MVFVEGSLGVGETVFLNFSKKTEQQQTIKSSELWSRSSKQPRTAEELAKGEEIVAREENNGYTFCHWNHL